MDQAPKQRSEQEEQREESQADPIHRTQELPSSIPCRSHSIFATLPGPSECRPHSRGSQALGAKMAL